MRFLDLVGRLTGQANIDPSLPQVIAQTPAETLADQEALSRGNLPPSSRRRLELAQERGTWASTLDVADLYLAELINIEPIALVVGESTFHAMTDTANHVLLGSTNDADGLINAYYEARDAALDRVLKQAHLVRAHAVIDAEYQIVRVDRNIVRVSITGTAVRFPGLSVPKRPLVSPMSGESFFKLLKKGWMPVDLAVGYHWHCQAVGAKTRAMETSYNNTEVTTTSRRFSETRKAAVAALACDARRRHAHGVVGVTVKTVIEETEILYSDVWGALDIDGTRYTPDENHKVEVKAVNLQFFVTGACVRKISEGRARRADLDAYLAVN